MYVENPLLGKLIYSDRNIFLFLNMQKIKGTVEKQKGGSSLVTVYCSEIPYCARSNVTVMSNVTEVLGKCKFWVNIVPYLL